MNNAMKKEFGLSKRIKVLLLGLLAVLVLLSCFVYILLNQNIKESVKAEAENSMIHVGQLNAKAIDRNLKNRQILITSFAEGLTEASLRNMDEILDKLRIYKENYDFYDMGVLTPEGMMYTILGTSVDVRDMEPFSEALEGTPMITESFPAVDGSGQEVNIFSVPVMFQDEMRLILTAAYRTEDLAKNLNMSDLEVKGHNFVLNEKGNAVIYPTEGLNEEYLNLIEYINNNAVNLVPEGKEKGSITFPYEGITYYAHFEPLEINNWYLMTCASSADVYAGADTVMYDVYMGMGIFWILLILSQAFLVALQLRHQNKVRKIIFEDSLTQGKNFEYMKLILKQMNEQERQKKAFAVMDVDNFKAYNIVYGGKNGDVLLKYIKQTFQEVLPEDHLYRNVADQFAAILNCDTEKEAAEKLQKVLDRFQKDIRAKKIHAFNVSIGICMLGNREELQTVYSDAMVAKNTVKYKHLRKYAFYDDRMRKQSREYMAYEAAFEDALSEGQFHVYYQPKYDMRDHSIVGSEALVRWIKPDGTIVSPGEFIPCFEQSGQIIRLDEAMIRMVCVQMKEMEEEGLPIPRVSVNLSRVHLMQPGILKTIRSLISDTQIDPENLAFEITESALYDDGISLMEIVSELHSLGCKVNMDDYGKGISSLNSLANIEFDVIKLDKAFIDKLGDRKMEAVIRSTIDLSEELGTQLIAEGIEEKWQADFLVKWGCYYAQGFYYSRPLSQEQYKELLRKAKNIATEGIHRKEPMDVSEKY